MSMKNVTNEEAAEIVIALIKSVKATLGTLPAADRLRTLDEIAHVMNSVSVNILLGGTMEEVDQVAIQRSITALKRNLSILETAAVGRGAHLVTENETKQ